MSKLNNNIEQSMELVEIVRKSCIEAARQGFLEASTSGLCADGAVEAAIGAIQSLDLEKVIPESES